MTTTPNPQPDQPSAEALKLAAQAFDEANTPGQFDLRCNQIAWMFDSFASAAVAKSIAGGTCIPPAATGETPRTDAAAYMDGETESVEADFARTLERENAALREERDYLKTYVIPEKDKHGRYWEDLAQQRIARLTASESALRGLVEALEGSISYSDLTEEVLALNCDQNFDGNWRNGYEHFRADMLGIIERHRSALAASAKLNGKEGEAP